MEKPPPTHYVCRIRLHSDGSLHDVILPVRLALPLGQTIVTLVQGKASRYHAMGDVITVAGHRPW